MRRGTIFLRTRERNLPLKCSADAPNLGKAPRLPVAWTAQDESTDETSDRADTSSQRLKWRFWLKENGGNNIFSNQFELFGRRQTWKSPFVWVVQCCNTVQKCFVEGGTPPEFFPLAEGRVGKEWILNFSVKCSFKLCQGFRSWYHGLQI